VCGGRGDPPLVSYVYAFLEKGARRNSAETQQPNHVPRSESKIKDGRWLTGDAQMRNNPEGEELRSCS